MKPKTSSRLAVIVRLVAAMAVATCAVASDVVAQVPPGAEKSPSDPPTAKPKDRPAHPALPDAPADKPPPQAGEKSPKLPQLGKVVPESPGERAKLLDDLYAHLATAPDEEASKPFVEAIERVWLTPGSDTINALMERAMQAANHKRNDLALQLLSAVVDLAPDYAEGWNRRAYVFYTEGDNERALGDLRRVLALDPNHYKALDGVGQIMRQLDRKPQALKAYSQLQTVHPYWPNIQGIVDELRRDVEGRGL
jgi:tetratricopeptide (TPR) repeat protein